ncbi:MAG: hypothetical protein ACR2IE_20355 [Candidatus Sumerlaeaceae bacterium]
MKKSLIAAAVMVVAGGGIWFYTQNAKAEEATTASAAAAILGKSGRADKAAKKAQRGEGGPLFKAAESVSALTTEQSAKLDDLKDAYNAKMKDVRKSSGDASGTADKKQARKEMRGKIQPINDETKAQIDGVLNEEQKKEFAAKLQAQMQEFKEKKTSTTKTE